MKPPRVVLDTNCVISALLFEHGRLTWLRRAWQREAVVPLADRATLRELIRVLGYPRFRLSPAEQEALLAEYLPWVEACTDIPPRTWPGLRDPNDAMFLDLAAAARADYVVSGDGDLRQLDPQACGVHVVSPADLLEILWDDFFQAPGVSEDCMQTREQPPIRARATL